MYVRWATFAIGFGLVMAPMVIGYEQVGPTLHDVAIGCVICILALAALENPALRFLQTLPAAWLMWTGAFAEPPTQLTEIAAGALLVAAALVPRARLAPERGRAGA